MQSRQVFSVPDSDTLCAAAEYFRVFGDSTRLGILCALSEGEMCVCELSRLLEVSQSALSHQLKMLRSSGAVRYRREGRTVFYRLGEQYAPDIIRRGLERMEGRT